MSDDRPPLLGRRTAEELLAQRVLLLDRPLDDENGSQLCAQLVLLADEDPTTDISLWIHSPGGSVPAMLAIRDTMRLLPTDVATVALGMAYSAGQFLLCSGTRGKRFVMPHAKVLMHQGSAGIGGYAPDIELQAEDLRSVRDTVLAIIAEETGQPLERVFSDSLRDRVYTAEEAVAYGFADAVVSDLAQLRPGVRRSIGVTARAGVRGAGVRGAGASAGSAR
ncbi:ClpP family protease [Nocardioides zeae]|uniref:ATP-dependent Clp protease proteolytic subunit n=1 Tax=Nocardioides zeae TaxID=1457234 RepID=A0AAJ1U1K3_9ACTN|nr:ATP-dependent Clp protease proteolytic subunit [Nocardioides zeae]MDQ1104220.1 ATP-dependent Clp protease protease subunit [Nocardioides zeae]